ncbi:hypothetical protein F5Y15DRAFT_391620 [Xylariaceae sp. FL0016]|nr:hypothetical protein F5Y15DRAFT_391620 [Xylariaceae sp. FL0016]
MHRFELGMLLLGAGANALVLAPLDISVRSSAPPTGELQCKTIQGPESRDAVPTSTARDVSTVTLPDATVTTTTIPVATSTEFITITDTATDVVTETTTDSTVTDTFSTTSTETETDTITETATLSEIETVTTTTTVATASTVAAQPGFVGIQDTINGYPAAQKRELSQLGRKRGKCALKTPHPTTYTTSPTSSHDDGYPAYSAGASSHGAYPSSAPASSSAHPSSAPASSSAAPSSGGVSSQYPQSVECTSTTTVQSTVTETVTGPAITSTTTPPAITVSTTTTETTTTTIVPDDATVTESFTETTTATATSTTTETTTSTTTTTVEEPTVTATVYEACGANNIIGPQFMDLGMITNVYNNGRPGATIYDTTTAATAYDCCVKCITGSDCSGSAFYSGRCILLHTAGRTCSSQSAASAQYVYSSSSFGYTLSNGNCGYQYNGGHA